MSGIDPALIESASLTDVGKVRTSNQDYVDEFKTPRGDLLLVVADGMGGHRGGATASRLATERIGEVFQASSADSPDTLYDALAAANARVHQESIDDPELRGMGTTVVALLFDIEGNAWVAHVGDSRAYRLHADGLEQITQDHSVVGEMVRRDLITAEEAEVHPRRNEILRSVGVEPEVEIDVAQVLVAQGDYFILCSDGLTGPVKDPKITEIVQAESPQNAAQTLVNLANENGGPDNVTVQIAMVPFEETVTLSYDGENDNKSDKLPKQQAASGSSTRLIVAVLAVLVIALAVYLASGGWVKTPSPVERPTSVQNPNQTPSPRPLQSQSPPAAAPILDVIEEPSAPAGTTVTQ